MMVLLAIWLPRTGRDWPYFNTVTSFGKIYIIQDAKLHEKMKSYLTEHLGYLVPTRSFRTVRCRDWRGERTNPPSCAGIA